MCLVGLWAITVEAQRCSRRSSGTAKLGASRRRRLGPEREWLISQECSLGALDEKRVALGHAGRGNGCSGLWRAMADPAEPLSICARRF
jgi:hypothetical protein